MQQAGRWRAPAAALIAAVLIASSCSDDDAVTTTTSSTSTTTTIATTTTAATTSTTTLPATTTTVPPAQIFPVAVSCSSELASYPCAALIDADPQTRWNAADGGVGAVVEFVFARPIELAEIVFDNVAEEEPFARNARIHWVDITTDDVAGVRSLELMDSSASQVLSFSSTGSLVVRIQITGAYPAQAYDGRPPYEELALADVGFLGYLADEIEIPEDSALGREPAAGLSTLAEVIPDRQGRIDDLAFDGASYLALIRLPNGESSIWSSPDGIGWEQSSVIGYFDPDDGPAVLAPAGEGRLIAAGSRFASAAVWRTDPDTAWQETRLENGSIADVTATPIGIVAVGATGDGLPAAWWSEDGTEWEATLDGEFGDATAGLDVVAASDELLIALGEGSAEGDAGIVVATSPDGRIWRSVDAEDFDAADVADLLVVGGTTVALEPAGPALWEATDPESWSARSLRRIVVPSDRLGEAVALSAIGDRLVVIGLTRPILPSEDDSGVAPGAWMREPDGIWIPLPQPSVAEEQEPLRSPGVVTSGRGRLVIAVDTDDGGLLVWVVQPA